MEEAKTKKCKTCRLDKPAAEFGPCKGTRDRLSIYCRPCQNAYQRSWIKMNPGQRRLYESKSIKKNKEAFRERRRLYRQRQTEQNPDRFRGWKRISQLRRLFAMIDATPKWADREAIMAIHREAAKRQEETGIQYHVDHIWPISGKNGCGLNVPWNLRIVTAEENIRKSNKDPNE